MKTIFLLVSMTILSCFTTATIGQKIITGTVYDTAMMPLSGVVVSEQGNNNATITDFNGQYSITISKASGILEFKLIGFITQTIKIKEKKVIDVYLKKETNSIEEVNEITVSQQTTSSYGKTAASFSPSFFAKKEILVGSYQRNPTQEIKDRNHYQPNNETYAMVDDNNFLDPVNNPLSTFSVDVDRASYTNIRRFINNGTLPPKEAVRIEEMINYFDYQYESSETGQPFSIHQEIAVSPWNMQHYILKVALQGQKLKKEQLPPSNLVFLIDVSGSMNSPTKLPLLKSSFKLLLNELRSEDYVSIVVYAGAAGIVLNPTKGNQKDSIRNALDKLKAGGSTAGGAGLKLAYKLAEENLIKNGNNRIILATDGDFNVGLSSESDMEKLIKEKRDKGIYITVAGFGMGNYKDSKMEIIADKGNGNYFYIDNIQEAKKAMIEEFAGTFYTIAKDVKFQIEFNPQHIAGYRLIGYENRMLNKEDFNDDKKDAGEIGSGHTVTALYEIIPKGASDVKEYFPGVDPLKYQNELNPTTNNKTKKYSNELLTLKLRYKLPNENKSKLISTTVLNNVKPLKEASSDFKFTCAVAAWGMKLRESEYLSKIKYPEIIKWAKNSKSYDPQGYKSEMVRLMETASLLSNELVKK